MDLKARVESLKKQGFIFLGERPSEIAIDRALVNTPELQGLEVFFRYLPTSDKPVTVNLDDLSKQDRAAFQKVLLACPVPDTARRVLAAKGGRVTIVPEVDVRFEYKGKSVRIGASNEEKGMPREETSMPVDILESPNHPKVPRESQALHLEFINLTMPAKFQAQYGQKAMDRWVAMREDLAQKKFDEAEALIKKAWGADGYSASPQKFEELPPNVKDMVRDAWASSWHNHNVFSSMSEALQALETVRFTSCRYSAKVGFQFRRPDVTGSGGWWGLRIFRH